MLATKNGLVASCAAVLGAALLLASAAAQAPAPSVWDGVYTDAQAERGRGFFAEHCASCHGGDLRGGEAKALVEKRFWTDWQDTTVDYLFTQISKNMPFSEDGSLAGKLPRAVYVDIVAHILRSNSFPAGPRELTAESAAGVRIVPKEGSGELPADALAHVVGCLARSPAGEWQLVRATRPGRVLASGTLNRTQPLGDRVIALKFVLTPLQKYLGHRMSATGQLMGEGGKDGLNVSSITSVAQTCE